MYSILKIEGQDGLKAKAIVKAKIPYSNYIPIFFVFEILISKGFIFTTVNSY